MRCSFLVLGIAAVLSPALAQAEGGSVQVTITNVRDSVGVVHVELCPESLWLKSCKIAAEAPAKQGTTVVTIPNVPPGRYGAVAFHDRNRNGKADRNFFGMPTEDVGFSNDALKRLAPPKFSDAAFDHDQHDQQISFRMKRF